MSKAEARRRRAGRNRIIAERQPNGQPRRIASQMADDAMSVALAARVRQGMAPTLAAAKDPRCGSELGRLWMTGEISQGEHDAGRLLAERYQRKRRAIDAPSAHATISSCYDVAKGPKTGLSAAEADRWRAEWIEALTLLTDCGFVVETEVRSVAIDDCAVKDLRSLRFGLQYLARRFDIPLDIE